MKFPVFDLHCDTALALQGNNWFAEHQLRSNSFHIDLTRASELAGYAQCFACFTSPLMSFPKRMCLEDVFERELSVLMRELNSNQDIIMQAFTAKEVRDNLKNGLMSAIFTIEGPAGFGYDPALLENLFDIGFRITTLGWNEDNPLTGSHITGKGLTDLGKEYVKEAQRVGMLVDVSHISDQGFWDIIKITQGPVIASHSNSRTLCNSSRNLTDDMFKAICETGGIVGINLYPDFLSENADLNAVCNHILHFAQWDTQCIHIALGGDLDGVDRLPAGFTGVESYNALADALLARGLTEKQVLNIFWNNGLGVLDKCCT